MFDRYESYVDGLTRVFVIGSQLSRTHSASVSRSGAT